MVDAVEVKQADREAGYTRTGELCRCICHHQAGVQHFAACCSPERPAAAQQAPAQADAEMVERATIAIREKIAGMFAPQMAHNVARELAEAALSALPSSGAATASDAALREAAQDVITHMFSIGIQGDDGEMCYIVRSDYIHALEQALATHTEAEGL